MNGNQSGCISLQIWILIESRVPRWFICSKLKQSFAFWLSRYTDHFNNISCCANYSALLLLLCHTCFNRAFLQYIVCSDHRLFWPPSALLFTYAGTWGHYDSFYNRASDSGYRTHFSPTTLSTLLYLKGNKLHLNHSKLESIEDGSFTEEALHNLLKNVDRRCLHWQKDSHWVYNH